MSLLVPVRPNHESKKWAQAQKVLRIWLERRVEDKYVLLFCSDGLKHTPYFPIKLNHVLVDSSIFLTTPDTSPMLRKPSCRSDGSSLQGLYICQKKGENSCLGKCCSPGEFSPTLEQPPPLTLKGGYQFVVGKIGLH